MFERNNNRKNEQKKLNPKEIFNRATIVGAGLLTAFATTFAKPESAYANTPEITAENNLVTPQPNTPSTPTIQTPAIQEESIPVVNTDTTPDNPSNITIEINTNTNQPKFDQTPLQIDPESIQIQKIDHQEFNLQPENHLPQEPSVKQEIEQTQKRLDRIKTHSISGYSPVEDYDINTLNQENGALINSQQVIQDSTEAAIVDEGEEYDAIHTTNTQFTVKNQPFVEKTTYEHDQVIQELHLTFEILVLKKNAEANNWENVIGAEDSYILPDGTLNPNYPLTAEQRRQQFDAIQKGGIVVDQDKVDKILESGITSREDLQGVSRNFSAKVDSSPIEELEEKATYSEIDQIQTLTVQESNKTIRANNTQTTLTQNTAKVSVDIVKENQQEEVNEYIESQEKPSDWQPVIENNYSDYDFSNDSNAPKVEEDLSKYLTKQSATKKVSSTKKVDTWNENTTKVTQPEEDLSKYLTKQPKTKVQKPNKPASTSQSEKFVSKLSKLAQRSQEIENNQNSNPIKPDTKKPKRTPLHNRQLLKKLESLRKQTTSEHQIGYKTSKTTTTKDKDFGQFLEVDAGIQKQTKLDITSEQTAEYSNFVNILRRGAENDSPETQAFLGGEEVSNANILFGIIAGVDYRNIALFSQFDYNYRTTHNITAGFNYGIASKNAALAVRASANYDLDSNEFYPQINAKGYYQNGNFAANAGVNLSTNPIYSNPNEATLNATYKIPLSKDSQKSITLSGSQQLGIGENHELYKDQTKLGANLRLNKFNIGATVSPKLTENSRHGGAVYANYQDKWGSIFVEGSKYNNKDKLLQVGASINLDKTSSIRAKYKMIQDGFHNDTEHVGTIEFNKQF